MQELEDYLTRAIYDDVGSVEVSENVKDIFRDAGWLPPDEVRNASGDLQLAATRLQRALDGRLLTDSEPPLGPLFDALWEALEPYQRAGEGAP